MRRYPTEYIPQQVSNLKPINSKWYIYENKDIVQSDICKCKHMPTPNRYHYIEYNHIESFKKYLNNLTHNMLGLHLIMTCCMNNRTEIFKHIVESITLKKISIFGNDTLDYEVTNNIITFTPNPIIFLEILSEYGIKLTPTNISCAINNNKMEVVKYALENGCDVGTCFDTFGLETNISLKMLKYLLDCNVDIEKRLYVILGFTIKNNNMAVLMFLLESYPHYNNICGGMCIMHNNPEALLYVLKMGADLSMIQFYISVNTSFSIVKIFLEQGHPISVGMLRFNLIKCLVQDDDLDNIHYLINNGADVQWIMDNEKEKLQHLDFNTITLQGVASPLICISPLEHIISKGKLNHIKFLITDYMDIFKSEINRLFVIAVANGQYAIATYLLDVGAEYNLNLIKVACFFGHFDMVKLLLQNGMDCNSSDENLYKITKVGSNKKGTYSTVYHSFIENNDTFRNDVYIYGYDHIKIIKLLLEYDIPWGNIDVLWPYSAQLYDVELFRCFMDKGFDMNKKWKNPDIWVADDRTLLEGGIIFGCWDVVEFLLKGGADTNITNVHSLGVINDNENAKKLLSKYNISL